MSLFIWQTKTKRPLPGKNFNHVYNSVPNKTTSSTNIKTTNKVPTQSVNTFGPSPNVQASGTLGSSSNPIQLINDNRINFIHQGTTYTLQEKEFLKSSPSIQAPQTDDDALSLYSSLQKHALIHNIFITPIDQVTMWDLSPGSKPPTCSLNPSENSNFHQVYQRMATALFTKLQKVKYDKVPFYMTMVNHEKSSQDGF